jgi:hypothetical protein
MSRGLIAGLFVVAAAVSLGSWLWSDPNGSRPATDARDTPVASNQPQSDEPGQRFATPESPEIIDLSHVFEPTGQELDLQSLLASTAGPEFLPLPRLVNPTADDDASLGSPWSLLRRQALDIIGRKCAELMCQSLPLAGAAVPEKADH